MCSTNEYLLFTMMDTSFDGHVDKSELMAMLIDFYGKNDAAEKFFKDNADKTFHYFDSWFDNVGNQKLD